MANEKDFAMTPWQRFMGRNFLVQGLRFIKTNFTILRVISKAHE